VAEHLPGKTKVPPIVNRDGRVPLSSLRTALTRSLSWFPVLYSLAGRVEKARP
jgi:hypothetical protein